MIENPIYFDIKKKFNELEVTYSDLMEICQGGPQIGVISINGNIIPSYRFGGPLLYSHGFIYVPVFVTKFLGSGFRLSRINTHTFDVEVFGKSDSLIFLDKIDGNRIYFFEDLDKTICRYYDLPE